MNALYNTGIRAYALAAKIASLKMPKARKMIAGQRHTIDTLLQARRDIAPEGFDVWVHAASLGEFEQARPMIERLRSQHPEKKMLLSFFSPSGYEVRKNFPAVDAVVYMPFDTPANVRRFLDAAAPKMAIFVKYEFWGNYLRQLQKRQIPTYIISAIFRPSQIFFRPYGVFMRKVLRCFNKLYVQDVNSKQLLSGIGIENVEVTGDTRFDRVTDVMRSTVEFPLIAQWKASGDAPVLIVGSSWQPDEARYIPYLNSHPRLKAIIAPHEFDKTRLASLQSQIQSKTQLFSEVEANGTIHPDTQVLIIDSFGKLSSIYRYGDAALIGGGFGAGIHNINEAAVYGMPVIFGPNHSKFKEASDLIACGGGFQYDTKEDAAELLDSFFAPERTERLRTSGAAAGAYIKRNLGATDKIYKQLF